MGTVNDFESRCSCGVSKICLVQALKTREKLCTCECGAALVKGGDDRCTASAARVLHRNTYVHCTVLRQPSGDHAEVMQNTHLTKRCHDASSIVRPSVVAATLRRAYQKPVAYNAATLLMNVLRTCLSPLTIWAGGCHRHLAPRQCWPLERCAAPETTRALSPAEPVPAPCRAVVPSSTLPSIRV